MIKELIQVCKELKEMFDSNKIMWCDLNVSFKFSELKRVLIWAEDIHGEDIEELNKELQNEIRDFIDLIESSNYKMHSNWGGKELLKINKIKEVLKKTQTVRIDNIPIGGNDFDTDKLGQNKIDTFDYKSAYNELLTEARCLIFKLSYNDGILSEEINNRIERIQQISTNAQLNKIEIEENISKIKQYPETPNNCIPKELWLKQLLEETKEIMGAMQTRIMLIEAKFKEK